MWLIEVNGKATRKRFNRFADAYRLYCAYGRILDREAGETIVVRLARLGE
jgi:hypothetical protein